MAPGMPVPGIPLDKGINTPMMSIDDKHQFVKGKAQRIWGGIQFHLQSAQGGVYEQLLNSVSYGILKPIRTDVLDRSENACRS